MLVRIFLGPYSPLWGTPLNPHYFVRMSDIVGCPTKAGCSTTLSPGQSRSGTGVVLTVTRTPNPRINL